MQIFFAPGADIGKEREEGIDINELEKWSF